MAILGEGNKLSIIQPPWKGWIGAPWRRNFEEGPGVREVVLGIREAEQREAELAHVILALGAAPRLAGGVDGGQEQADQDADDADHHQQLDQREAAAAARARAHERSFP